MDGHGGRPRRPHPEREVIRQLDRLSDPDAIVASNSSSLPTSYMLDDVEHRWRVLNMH